MTDPTDVLLRSIEARSAARARAADETREAPARLPYLRAAAVLHVFDPARLQPATPVAGDPSVLLADSEPAIGWRHAGLRTLTLDARRTALRSLGTRTAMRAALAANPDRVVTGPQRQFERWLSGGRFALERMPYVELEDLRQLYQWGLGDLPGLPPRDQVDRARVRRSTVAVFEHLVDRAFVGRTAELKVVDDHVRGPGGRRSLAICGPGGMGKTALVGRFLIRHVEGGRDWFPFAYLPFDSDTLDVREPFTLLLAIASQLGAQVAADPSPLGAALRDRQEAFSAAVGAYRDRRGSLQRRASEIEHRGSRITKLSAADVELYDEFAKLLDAAGRLAGGAGAPILLVLDTFEEVVYRAVEDLLGLALMLDHLHRRLPQLRVVIAGRTRPDGSWTDMLPVRVLALGDLDEPDAVRLLGRLGVEDTEVAAAVARQVGGNPMSLRLAASVIERSGTEGLQGVSVRKVGAELVRGQLYRRLLDHIHDEDVRKLAHPGMVLRRVTAGVIEDVLAPACDLGPVDGERARRLFDGLRREHALVSLDDDGALRYREEVRRPVLDLLARDCPTQVRDIHERAVRHYLPLGSPAERAEELYHRMMLQQRPDVLDGRWAPGVERYLGTAADELPPAQRRWLAGRMSIELPPEVYRLAELDEWERLVGRKIVEIVRHGGPEEVLRRLDERPDRTPESPLPALEARAWLDLHRPADAARVLDAALAAFPPLGNPGRLAEILWLRAQASPDPASALTFLREAADVVEPMRSPLAYVQVLTEILGLLPDGDPDVAGTRRALAGALGRLTEAEVDHERSLVRLALVRLGPNYPQLVGELARLTLFDLGYLGAYGPVDLTSAVGPVVDLLGDVVPQVRELARGLHGGDTQALVQELVEAISQQLRPDASGTPPLGLLAEAVLLLLRTEHASLSGSSLAGLDDYREPWELEGIGEVLA